MREPYLGRISQAMVRRLEINIPQMITFIDTEIDLQPWERAANATYISDSETEIDLMSLMRDMMGTGRSTFAFNLPSWRSEALEIFTQSRMYL
jgi:hypothetical protein